MQYVSATVFTPTGLTFFTEFVKNALISHMHDAATNYKIVLHTDLQQHKGKLRNLPVIIERILSIS